MKDYPRAGHTEKFWKHHDKEDYKCPHCGRGIDEVKQFQVHHKNEHPSDGSIQNLVALCRDCHWDEHDISPGEREGQWSERFFDEYNSDENPLKYL
jgi:5-methylcytosine-specific restriction endonuclease McrA